jgi:hypothetical protein
MTSVESRFVTECPDCHGPIMWAWTKASDCTERMPIDAEPVANGNVHVYQEGRRLVCDAIGTARDKRILALAGNKLYQYHRIMCPRAHGWARVAKSRPAPRRTIEAPEGLW